jgi:hypothetical protein
MAYFTSFLKSRKTDFDRPKLNGLKSEFWQGKRRLAKSHLFLHARTPANPIRCSIPRRKTTIDGWRGDACSNASQRRRTTSKLPTLIDLVEGRKNIVRHVARL